MITTVVKHQVSSSEHNIIMARNAKNAIPSTMRKELSLNASCLMPERYNAPYGEIGNRKSEIEQLTIEN